MKKLFTLKLLILIILFGTNVKSTGQALTEDFSYTTGSLLTANGYIAISAGGTTPLTVTSPGLTYAASPSSGIGNAVTMGTSGEDDTKTFAPTISSGNAYASFLINVSSAQTGGDYFFSLYDAGGYKARVFIKSTTGGFLFGIAKNSTTAVYETTARSFGTTYLVVLKYTFNTTNNTDDVVSFFVNPILGSAEPETPTIAATSSSSATDAGTIDRIALRQGSSTAASAQIIDAIRIGTTWASVTPVLDPTTTSISPNSATAGGSSFTLTVNGTNFVNGSNITWNGSARTTTFVSSTQLTTSIPNTDIATAGTAQVGVTTTGAAAVSNTQTFTINSASAGSPSLTATALTDFGNVCINTSSAPNSFTITGSNLDGTAISIAALPGFSYSLTFSGTYTSTLSITYTGNSINKDIYVKFIPVTVQSYNGDIVVSGGGAPNYNVPTKGSGIGVSITTVGSSAVTATTATVSGSITNGNCVNFTNYGFLYSPNAGFPNNTASAIISSNLNAENFSANLTGLSPNVRYYYKAFATNGTDSSFGAQLFFTCTPLPVSMASQPNLSFTETFADIANWGSFFSVGIGANHWSGLSATATAPATGIPNPVILTASTQSFQGSTFLSSGGVQKGTDQIPSTESIVLLSTGSPDNTTSAAIDFYMDFTGLNAGTLSFDYQSIYNSPGTTPANDTRPGSLRVYATTDGTNFTELTFASILNFINNTPVSGSKTNIALPASFNNNPMARLRFYYHNGNTGSGAGSRPKISIDNLTVTAVPSTPCTTPTAQPTAMVFGTKTDVSIQGSFTAANPSSDQYLTIVSTNSSLTSNPVDGVTYSVGDALGDGTVIAKGNSLSFTATNLSPSTNYYFFTYAFNGLCTGGPLYLTANPLTASTVTNSALPPCSAPSAQPNNLVFDSVSINLIRGSFSATTADEYLVLMSTSSTLSNNPVNGQAYSSGDAIGNATVVKRSATTTFTAQGLTAGTQYYFYVFSSNSQNCVNGPAYNITAPLNGSQNTQPLPPCTAPNSQPTYITLNASNTIVSGAFNASASADDYLVIRSTSSTLSATPANGTDYAVGTSLGGGTVISNSSGTTFSSNNLNPGTIYYFFVFAANKNCSGGTKYLTTLPLTGSVTTSSIAQNNYYFGTLHSHSDYSDGNQDHPGYKPSDDYNYAMTAQCMDFLGISEHNHFSSPDNPGNMISTFHLGSVQADSFTNVHPNFLAMYGMEWGVISGGGHVVVYGDKMNSLFGWESGSGGWGPSNNYDVYVPKSTYIGPTGLFKVVNDSITRNTFATLAHPNLTDFNNLANIAYIDTADNAIVGVAVESGPATTTNITYSNPGSSMYYLWYYQMLLAKGYHLGPTIDHDNHNTTFGHTTFSRTAVLAPTLTKTDLVLAMRNMHFYATEDCDSRVDFAINTRMMGSVFSDRNAPSISVTLSDATTSTISAVIRVMSGTPGSGATAVKIDSIIGNTLYFVDNTLTNGATAYYYIDITNGATRIVTSPIWYTRTDVTTPPAEYFRSITSGNWNSISTWESSADNSSWHSATTTPDYNSNTVTIQSGHTVTVTANVTIDETFINAGGILSVATGTTLTVTNALSTGLTVKSDATGSGSIGSSLGTISGNVTVQRYIPANANRAWRLLSIPTTTTQTINAAWQNGQATGVTGTLGLGTWITGNNSNTSFDSQSGNSLLTYNSGTNAWTGVTNTTSPIATDNGYMLFVRGDRTAINGSSAITATTLSTTGSLKQGSYPTTPISVAGGQFGLIGNPYASQIDLRNITITGLDNTFYIWNSKLSGVGGYQTLTKSGSDFIIVPNGGVMNNIESGQAFFVHAPSTTPATTGTISFTESAKSTGNTNNSFRVTGTPAKSLITNLYSVDAGGENLADGTMNLFDNNYSNTVNGMDALKLTNFGLNLGLIRDSKTLVVEKRSELTSTDIISYSLTNAKEQSYRFEFVANGLDKTGLTAYLVDNYLKNTIPIDLNGTTSASFAINSNASSSAADRFYIAFAKPATIVNNASPSIIVYPNPVTNGNIKLQFTNMPQGDYQVRILNNLGQLISAKQITHTQGSGTETIQLKGISKGVYQVEITKPDNTKIIQKVIND